MGNHQEVRNTLVDFLQRDQFGPYSGDNEELPENPLRRYMVGILHPQGTIFDPADDDGGTGKEPVTKEDDSEPGLKMSNTVAPSSYGLTFSCAQDVESLVVRVKAGRYTPVSEENKQQVSGQDSAFIPQKWIRDSLAKSFTLKINEPGDSREEVDGDGKLTIRLRCREIDSKGLRSVTISVVNENKCAPSVKQQTRALNSFFQVYFEAEGMAGATPFVSRTTLPSDENVSEENATRLLYRNVRSFGVGHGCAADWIENTEQGGCSKVFSSFVPTHTVYPMVQPKDLGLKSFSVKKISESDPDNLNDLLSCIPDQYDIWIDQRSFEIKKIETSLQPQAEEHLVLCRRASDRIRNGINLLTSDKDVYNAFILMHHAMLHQVARSRWAEKDRPEDGPEMGYEHAWYPFQIAFILQNLESLVDPSCEERKLVDLLWFPTGGGKTEAYLGIIAFLIFFRRIKTPEDSFGTIAIMRYTLRLLTVDQFYRAALLACSCEVIRRDPKYGLTSTEPVSIGLWVGGDASPNNWKIARKELQNINAGSEEPQKSNPLKVRKCPWCGEEIGSPDYTVPDENTPMRIRCPDPDCNFADGLPVWVIDTDVYNIRPSLIIGTVDKFARIPWMEEAGNIFGADNRSKPPELIIQDELHLISGPLGTMVGLYETAVDSLCRDRNGHPPKIIASTATIRNAESQVQSLFCRSVCQFPPPGLEYDKSFFAKEDRTLPGRQYCGVFTPGTSPTTALVRTFGILLHGGKTVGADDSVRDAYWTLMAYFNSLRELGGASIQVEDDVNDYLRVCYDRDGLTDPLMFRQVENKAELTGRVDSTELDEIRDNLWLKVPDDECFDVVLATNMISVGLDVPRLGLMAVVGQPKSTSEYIQATSRIGRRHPGLVVTIYNWTRSRDRSHFERFKGYHSRLYSEVEATSVTPFSSRSRDRGLHAVLISLVRHLVKNMNKNSAAGDFVSSNPDVVNLIDEIVNRVKAVDSQEAKETQKALSDIITQWERMTTGGDLQYTKKKAEDAYSLMVSAEEATAAMNSFATLNSLRNIDPAAGLKLEG